MKGIWLLQRLDKAKVRKWLLLCVFSFGSVYSSVAWDRKRHDAIASNADQHLTRRAKRNIARYLEHSIVYYASYMDKHRDAPEFRGIEHVSAMSMSGCSWSTPCATAR